MLHAATTRKWDLFDAAFQSSATEVTKAVNSEVGVGCNDTLTAKRFSSKLLAPMKGRPGATPAQLQRALEQPKISPFHNRLNILCQQGNFASTSQRMTMPVWYRTAETIVSLVICSQCVCGHYVRHGRRFDGTVTSEHRSICAADGGTRHPPSICLPADWRRYVVLFNQFDCGSFCFLALQIPPQRNAF